MGLPINSRVRVTVTRHFRRYCPSLRGVRELTGRVLGDGRHGVTVFVTDGRFSGHTFLFPAVYVKECPG